MSYYTNIADGTLIFIMLTVSLNLLFGSAGQVSVAQAAFAAVGAYTSGYLALSAGVAIVPSILIGTLAAALCGAVVSLPALRLSEEFLMLLTLAIQTIVISLATALPQFGGVDGLLGLPTWKFLGLNVTNPNEMLPLLLIVTLVVFFICRRFTKSPYGIVLRSIRDDESVSRSLGKQVFTYKIQMFALTAGIAGFAGGLLAFYDRIVSPSQYGFDQSVELFAMVVIGGLGSPYGAVFGAIVISLSGPILQKVVNLGPAQASLVQLMVYGVLLVVVTMFLPRGIFPEDARFGWRKRRSQPFLGPRNEIAGSEQPGDASQTVDFRVATLTENQSTVVARGVTCKFEGLTAVDRASVELLPGKITALVGPNGAGKTTLFNLLAGVIPVDGGSIYLNDVDITHKSSVEISRLGLVRSFQDVRILPSLTLLENVALGVPHQIGETFWGLWFRPGATHRSKVDASNRAMELLAFVGLSDIATTRARDLGFGQQKLLAIARLLATDAPVLLLDEPGSGIESSWLDRVLALIESIRDQGRTVCVVEHNLEVVRRLADTVYFMDLGKIVAQGSVEQLMEEHVVVQAYFGTN